MQNTLQQDHLPMPPMPKTKEEYYTGDQKCYHCGSDLEDVGGLTRTNEYMVEQKLRCPGCGHTFSERFVLTMLQGTSPNNYGARLVED